MEETRAKAEFPGWDALADRLVSWAIAEPRVRAVWVEGASAREVRRPYPHLDAHVAADEPEFDGVFDELRGAVERVLGARLAGIEDVPRFAKELRLEWGDPPAAASGRVVLERTSLLAKRPRAHAAILFDRTGHVPHVMDTSLRNRGSPEGNALTPPPGR